MTSMGAIVPTSTFFWFMATCSRANLTELTLMSYELIALTRFQYADSMLAMVRGKRVPELAIVNLQVQVCDLDSIAVLIDS